MKKVRNVADMKTFKPYICLEGSIGLRAAAGVFVLTACLLIIGCQGSSDVKKGKEGALSSLTAIEDMDIPDFASASLKSAGGKKNWSRTDELSYDCLITIYRADKSHYLTEQHHKIGVRQGSIAVSGSESAGNYEWIYSPKKFKKSGASVDGRGLGLRVSERVFSEAVLDLVTAPVRLLDIGVMNTYVSEPVQKEGLWYYPIERSYPAASPDGEDKGFFESDKYWSRVVFYQRSRSSLMDFIWYADIDSDTYVAVRGYNYKPVTQFGGEGVLVPRKIEIYRTETRGVLGERFAAIDIKRVYFESN